MKKTLAFIILTLWINNGLFNTSFGANSKQNIKEKKISSKVQKVLCDKNINELKKIDDDIENYYKIIESNNKELSEADNIEDVDKISNYTDSIFLIMDKLEGKYEEIQKQVRLTCKDCPDFGTRTQSKKCLEKDPRKFFNSMTEDQIKKIDAKFIPIDNIIDESIMSSDIEELEVKEKEIYNLIKKKECNELDKDIYNIFDDTSKIKNKIKDDNNNLRYSAKLLQIANRDSEKLIIEATNKIKDLTNKINEICR